MENAALAGFVIHSNNRSTLGACLESLHAVCDRVVCVDSGSTDGSAEIARASGAHVVRSQWRGYGAARARAMQEIPPGFPYVLFLDSDEALDDPSRDAIRRWRRSRPSLPYYTITRDDWATVDGRTFRYRSERRKRLVRCDHARWTADMIVHESLAKAPSAAVGARIDHQLVDDWAGYAQKLEVYALLWAVRAHREDHLRPSRLGHWLGTWVRDGLLKGALWRGGLAGAKLAALHADYHVRKYERLAELRQGRHRDLDTLFRNGDFSVLLQRVATVCADTDKGAWRIAASHRSG